MVVAWKKKKKKLEISYFEYTAFLISISRTNSREYLYNFSTNDLYIYVSSSLVKFSRLIKFNNIPKEEEKKKVKRHRVSKVTCSIL